MKFRLTLSVVAAIIPTLALLYLMTRLILPIEDDPTVNEMIASFELRRVSKMVDSAVRRRELELLELQKVNPPRRPDFVEAQSQRISESDANVSHESDE